MAIVTDGLVIYLNSKQGVSGSTWTNIAPNATKYHGQFLNTPPEVQAEGMYFDGAGDYVEFPRLNPELSTTATDWTIEIRVKLDSYLTAKQIIARSGSSTALFWPDITNNRFIVNLFEVSTSRTYYLPYSGLVNGSEYYLSLSYDSANGELRLRVNGGAPIIVSTATGCRFATSSLTNPAIGRNFSSNWITGIADNFRFYNRVLSEAEVAQNYAVGTELGFPVASNPVDSGALSLSGSGTMSCTADVSTFTYQLGSATLQGAGTLSTVPGLIQSGSSSLAGAGTISVIPRLTLLGSLSLAGVGTISATARVVMYGVSSLSAVGVISAFGDKETLPSYVPGEPNGMNATGTLSVTARKISSAISSLSATGLLTASSAGVVLAAATLTGVGMMNSIPLLVVRGGSSLSGAGTISASARSVLQSNTSMSAVGTLSAIPGFLLTGVSALSGTGTLSVGAIKTLLGVSGLQGTGGVSSNALLIVRGASGLVANSGLTANPRLTLLGNSVFLATGVVTVFEGEAVVSTVLLQGQQILVVELGGTHFIIASPDEELLLGKVITDVYLKGVI